MQDPGVNGAYSETLPDIVEETEDESSSRSVKNFYLHYSQSPHKEDNSLINDPESGDAGGDHLSISSSHLHMLSSRDESMLSLFNPSQHGSTATLNPNEPMSPMKSSANHDCSSHSKQSKISHHASSFPSVLLGSNGSPTSPTKSSSSVIGNGGDVIYSNENLASSQSGDSNRQHLYRSVNSENLDHSTRLNGDLDFTPSNSVCEMKRLGASPKHHNHNSDPLSNLLNRLEGQIQTIYARQFCKVELSPWLDFTTKPDWSTYIDARIRERRHNSILLAPALDMDEVQIRANDCLIVVGPRLSGRSVWVHRFAYQYGLKLLPTLNQFKLVLLITSLDILTTHNHNPQCSLDQFIIDILSARTKQIAQKDNPVTDTEIAKLIDHFKHQSERVLLLIDIDSNHCGVMDLPLTRKLIVESRDLSEFRFHSVVLSLPHHCLTECLSILPTSATQRVFDIVLWTDDDILKFLRDFSGLFREDDAKTEFLEFIDGLNCCKLLSIADNCAIICFLYYLDRTLLSNRPPHCRTDLLNLLFQYIVREHIRSETSETIHSSTLYELVQPFTERAWQLVLDGEAEGYQLEIPLKQDTKMSICSQEFEEFLAAKYLTMSYYHSRLAEHMGDPNEWKNMDTMFEQCWDVDHRPYHLGRVCVFLSALFLSQNEGDGSEFFVFMEWLKCKYSQLSERGRKESLRICGECSLENQCRKEFVERIKAYIDQHLLGCSRQNSCIASSATGSSEKEGNCHTYAKSAATLAVDTTDFALTASIPDGLDARNLSSLKLNEATLANDDVLQRLGNCLSKASKLRELEIDFTSLDPALTQRVAFSPTDIDYTPLKEIVNTIKFNSALRYFSCSLKIEIMSCQAIEIVSSLFEDDNGLTNLISLGIKLHHKELDKSDYELKDIDSYGTYFSSVLANYLTHNQTLKSLALSTYFIQHNLLASLHMAILNHAQLDSFHLQSSHISGDPISEACDAVNQQTLASLGDILASPRWLTIALDIGDFVNLYNRRSQSATNLQSGKKESGKDLGEKKHRRSRKNRRSSGALVNELTKGDNLAEYVQIQILRSLLDHGSLESLSVTMRNCLSTDVLDHITDFIEKCSYLKRLEFSLETIDDSFLLAVGCGVVCATQLEAITLTGSLIEMMNGGSLPGFFQSCTMSPRLRAVTIKAQPMTLRCLDSLCLSLPDIPLFPSVRMTVHLTGELHCRDVKNAEKKLDKLKRHVFHRNFHLDLQLLICKKLNSS